MLQWGFPQFYNQGFMQFPAFNTFSMPAVNPFMPTFSSIFNPFARMTFPSFNNIFAAPQGGISTPSFNQFNFLNNQLQTPTLPKPQGIRSTISDLYDSAVNTTKKVVKKGKEYAKKGYDYAKKGYQAVKNFGHKMVETARKYLGYNKKDGSYKKFTQGRNEKWCADFVSYVARECGKDGFNFPAVQGIWDWGKKNGKFHTTAKVGDAVIFKGVDKKGKKVSHTGIVTSVENGIVKTIEGNTSGKVAERSYSINDSRITGYVTIA